MKQQHSWEITDAFWEAAHWWMNRFHKILVRYEKLESSYRGLLMLACAFIAFLKALII
jgi:hypothetical protein